MKFLTIALIASTLAFAATPAAFAASDDSAGDSYRNQLEDLAIATGDPVIARAASAVTVRSGW